MTDPARPHEDQLLRHSALHLHLLSVHCDGGALQADPADAADRHHREHHGPGGLRLHEGLHWDYDQAIQVLTEAAEMSDTTIEDLLRLPDRVVTLPADDHLHARPADRGGWTVCPDGPLCTTWPRWVDTVQVFDGETGDVKESSGHEFATAHALILDGISEALRALESARELTNDSPGWQTGGAGVASRRAHTRLNRALTAYRIG